LEIKLLATGMKAESVYSTLLPRKIRAAEDRYFVPQCIYLGRGS
jgi:hypothetical protein